MVKRYRPPVFGFLLNEEALVCEGLRRKIGEDKPGWPRRTLMENTANAVFVGKAVEMNFRAHIVFIKRRIRKPGPGGDLGFFVAIAIKEQDDEYEAPPQEVIEEYMKAVHLKSPPQWARMEV